MTKIEATRSAEYRWHHGEAVYLVGGRAGAWWVARSADGDIASLRLYSTPPTLRLALADVWEAVEHAVVMR